jgi:hypothetical protein
MTGLYEKREIWIQRWHEGRSSDTQEGDHVRTEAETVVMSQASQW